MHVFHDCKMVKKIRKLLNPRITTHSFDILGWQDWLMANIQDKGCMYGLVWCGLICVALYNIWYRRNKVVCWSKKLDNLKLVHKVQRLFSSI